MGRPAPGCVWRWGICQTHGPACPAEPMQVVRLLMSWLPVSGICAAEDYGIHVPDGCLHHEWHLQVSAIGVHQAKCAHCS